MEKKFNDFLQKRIVTKNDVDYTAGPVLLCPARDLRTLDNPALFLAQQIALKQGAELEVVFVLSPDCLRARKRHYDFMFEGLREFEASLAKLHIPFKIVLGDNIAVLDEYIEKGVGTIVTDFSPLRHNHEWKTDYANICPVPFYEVDAHNVIPPAITSPKQEFAAYTIRPKIYKLVKEHMTEEYVLVKHVLNKKAPSSVDWTKVLSDFACDPDPEYCGTWIGGSLAAQKTLSNFMDHKLSDYMSDRNDPNKDAQSDLSLYINFGFISRRTIINQLLEHTKTANVEDILEKKTNAAKSGTSASAFLEELLVRSELAENFCYYNKNYDNAKSFPDWAQKTHAEHKNDTREFIYTLKEFETAETHDDLWNAAQRQLLAVGKMHGYMRMYWAKKILEWTPSKEQAMKVAVHLNDTYSLDGRDSGGYAGIAWSIGGVHDRAWFERLVFGQIRYMNYNGCKSKFDIKKYMEKWGKQEAKLANLFSK